jgi:hypothetical protein
VSISLRYVLSLLLALALIAYFITKGHGEVLREDYIPFSVVVAFAGGLVLGIIGEFFSND